MESENSDKIILDLCGGTGAWSRSYKEAGYKVFNITLPDFDIKAWCEGEIETEEGRWVKGIGFGLPQGKDNCAPNLEVFIPVEDVYGILAAPPCTMFSLARAGAKTPRDFVGAMKTVKACMEVIWYCRTYGKLKWWALENPRGLLRQFLGRPAFSFEAWWYGDNLKKPTDLWGYFNLPIKKRVRARPVYPRKGPGSWSNRSKGGDPKRSITPAGFAKAFYEANR